MPLISPLMPVPLFSASLFFLKIQVDSTVNIGVHNCTLLLFPNVIK